LQCDHKTKKRGKKVEGRTLRLKKKTKFNGRGGDTKKKPGLLDEEKWKVIDRLK